MDLSIKSWQSYHTKCWDSEETVIFADDIPKLFYMEIDFKNIHEFKKADDASPMFITSLWT